jgi:hypothetical protein
MADTKISAMAAASSLTGTEIVPLLQGGANKRTTTQAIANLGGSGLALIDSGTISSPVEVLDVELPSGYFVFQFFFASWDFNSSDYLSALFSFDGGSVFLCDTTNWDSYRIRASKHLIGNLVAATFDDSVMISNAPNPGITPIHGSFDIFPGNNAEFSSIFGRYAGIGQQHLSHSMHCHVNAEAIVVPTTARATHIRWQPYGNGDSNPPTGGGTITAGSWALIGVPTP